MPRSKRIGDSLFLQGMIGRDGTGAVAPELIAQTQLALESVRTEIAAYGLGLRDIGRVRIFLTDPSHWHGSGVGAVVNEFFGPNRPPLTVVGVVGLVEPAAQIEIEVDVVSVTGIPSV